MIKRTFFIILALSVVTAGSLRAKIKVVTSSSDLGSIAGEIGGAEVEVSSIGRGKSNLHFVEMLPSYMLKVSQADIYFKVGLSLDRWAAGVIDGSRNSRLKVIDCSAGIDVIDRPSGKVDASMGDAHPEGNPHYWLDPRNGKIIAGTIREALAKADPANADAFQTNYDSFSKRLDSAWLVWSARAEKLKGTAILSYHSSWAYFARAFGINVAGFIEPKPGIEPTASHTAELIELANKQNVKIIFREPYFSDRAPNAVAKATGGMLITVASSVGGTKGATDYFSLFDELLGALEKGAGVK